MNLSSVPGRKQEVIVSQLTAGDEHGGNEDEPKALKCSSLPVPPWATIRPASTTPPEICCRDEFTAMKAPRLPGSVMADIRASVSTMRAKMAPNSSTFTIGYDVSALVRAWTVGVGTVGEVTAV